jgi:hypothetical protein
MLDRLSTDTLTNDILNAIIRRTSILLSKLEQQQLVEYYEGDRFIWNLDPNQPTLSIDFNTHNSSEGIVYLWWNRETEDDKIEVFSNIIIDARQNLNYYTALEKIIFSELEILSEDIPLTMIEMEVDDERLCDAV